MKHVKLDIEIEFCSMDELSADEQTVVKCACAATRNSYANYSHFHVGAALLLGNGKVVIGANQETPHSLQGFVPSARPSFRLRPTTPTSPSDCWQ